MHGCSCNAQRSSLDPRIDDRNRLLCPASTERPLRARDVDIHEYRPCGASPPHDDGRQHCALWFRSRVLRTDTGVHGGRGRGNGVAARRGPAHGGTDHERVRGPGAKRRTSGHGSGKGVYARGLQYWRLDGAGGGQGEGNAGKGSEGGNRCSGGVGKGSAGSEWDEVVNFFIIPLFTDDDLGKARRLKRVGVEKSC